MLAKKIKVFIFGQVSKNLYTGYYTDENNKNLKVYVISEKELMFNAYGQVIATLKTADSNVSRLVVSCEHRVMYEPQIRHILKAASNLKILEMTCLYEKSCGALIFFRKRQGVRILLVKNQNGRYWSFPKGHMELNETEEQTAVREIKEETNLDVQLVEGFREVSDYCPYGNIKKRVVFFLARAFTDEVREQPEEIADHIWVDIQQAKKYCTYDNDLRVIEKANMLIAQNRI